MGRFRIVGKFFVGVFVGTGQKLQAELCPAGPDSAGSVPICRFLATFALQKLPFPLKYMQTANNIFWRSVFRVIYKKTGPLSQVKHFDSREKIFWGLFRILIWRRKGELGLPIMKYRSVKKNFFLQLCPINPSYLETISSSASFKKYVNFRKTYWIASALFFVSMKISHTQVFSSAPFPTNPDNY